jgi:hypothetical protein
MHAVKGTALVIVHSAREILTLKTGPKLLAGHIVGPDRRVCVANRSLVLCDADRVIWTWMAQSSGMACSNHNLMYILIVVEGGKCMIPAILQTVQS